MGAGMKSLDPQFWWYLSRGSGLMAWAAAGFSCALGTLLATRILKPYDRPAWLLALHCHLAAVFLVLTAAHLASLVLDSYISFGWRDLAVPMASSWKPGAVAYGVIATYVALVVEASSLARRWIPRNVWHGLHLLSYVAFVLVTVHAVLAGTDARTTAFAVGASILVFVFVLSLALKILQKKGPQTRDVFAGRSPRTTETSAEAAATTPR